MNNPYEPPTNSPRASAKRTPFVLAAIGAGAASLYWALLTVLIGLSDLSGVQAIMPIVLIGLYAFRGYQVFSGDRAAAQRLLWLHGFGALMGIYQITKGDGGLWTTLQGVKVSIHLLGGAAAYLASRETNE